MMVAAGLGEELHPPTVVLPKLDHGRGVVLERHGPVGRAVARDQQDAGLDGGQESLGGPD